MLRCMTNIKINLISSVDTGWLVTVERLVIKLFFPNGVISSKVIVLRSINKIDNKIGRNA